MADEEFEPGPKLYDSLTGFIASDPQLGATRKGDARFYAKVGQEHGHVEPDGSFTKEPTTFHDLVAYKGAAIRAHANLVKGDNFIARGRLEEYTSKTTGETRKRFVAYGFGHDMARTRYEVDRTPRHAGAEREKPAATIDRRTTDRPGPVIGQ